MARCDFPQAGQEALTGAVERTEAWCRGEIERRVREEELGDNRVETFNYYEPALPLVPQPD